MTLPLTEYGVTPQGFRAKRLIDIKNELEDYFIGEFGEINLDAQSVAGQIIGIYSKVLADIWENMTEVYESQYPNSASGVSLDNVVQLNGLNRLPALRTSVIGVATGTENTLIIAGKLARQPTTGEIFFVTQDSYITRENSVQNVVNVNATAAQIYSILISGTTYFYKLPTMNFSGPFVSGNIINVRVNGVNIPTTTYTTSSANTFNLLRTNLLTSPAIASATVVGNTIQLVPALGYQITINSVDVAGAGAPTYSETLRVPADTTTVAQYLAAALNTSANVSASFSGPNITITATDTEFPYSLNVGTNLSITQTSSPIPFLAQTYGPVAVPVNSLTEILTPVAGWSTIDNFKAGVTGRNQETDEELRLRRANSLRVLGSGTVEAIRARVLQEVPGVTSVLVFENVTLTQDPIEVTFSANFVTGNNITVTIDGNNLGSVAWTGSQVGTMNAIAALALTYPAIKTATVGGLSNQSLTLEMNDGEDVNVSFNITGGASQPTYIVSGGRPPKSFETVVQGGTDQAVALKIWQLKPAGIETFGNTQVIIVDSQGNNQPINFSRATPIYIWANIILTLNPQETFPPNGQQLVAQAILAYGNSLGIGVDVFIQRVQAAIFSVTGIASAVVQLARTLNVNDIPSYGTSDIDIGETEISVWNLNRIVVSV